MSSASSAAASCTVWPSRSCRPILVFRARSGSWGAVWRLAGCKVTDSAFEVLCSSMSCTNPQLDENLAQARQRRGGSTRCNLDRPAGQAKCLQKLVQPTGDHTDDDVHMSRCWLCIPDTNVNPQAISAHAQSPWSTTESRCSMHMLLVRYDDVHEHMPAWLTVHAACQPFTIARKTQWVDTSLSTPCPAELLVS